MMNKRVTSIAVAAVAGLVAFTSNATAQNATGQSTMGENAVEQSDFNYTCRKGSVTVTSKTPCYISAYGISVPGDDDAADAKGNEGGVNKGGPKDLGGKPKGGGNS